MNRPSISFVDWLFKDSCFMLCRPVCDMVSGRVFPARYLFWHAASGLYGYNRSAMYRLAAFSLLWTLGSSCVFAQAVQYLEDRKLWLLTTSHSSYAMGVAPNGQLQHIYWGAPIWRAQDLMAAAPRRDISSFDPRQMLENEEFPGWGGARYYEPAVKITRADGDRDLVLQYAAHRMLPDGLDIELKDIRDDIRVVLHYRVYPSTGILRRSASVRNSSGKNITLESAQSATWYLPPGDGYRLSYLTGRWAAETQLNREPIHEGMKVFESRKGHTSHNFNPGSRSTPATPTKSTAASGSARWHGAATGASPSSRRPTGRFASRAASTPSISPIR